MVELNEQVYLHLFMLKPVSVRQLPMMKIRTSHRLRYTKCDGLVLHPVT